MALLDLFRRRKTPSAAIARERLQIILAHERTTHATSDFLPALQQDILQVVGRYFQIEPDAVKVQIERHDSYSVLELNISLPADAKPAPV